VQSAINYRFAISHVCTVVQYAVRSHDQSIWNKNLAIASRLRVSCAHNTSKAFRHLKLAVHRFKCASAYILRLYILIFAVLQLWLIQL